MNKQFPSLEKAFGNDVATAIMEVIDLKVQKKKENSNENAFDRKFRLLTNFFFVFAVGVTGFIIGIVFMVLMNNLTQV